MIQAVKDSVGYWRYMRISDKTAIGVGYCALGGHDLGHATKEEAVECFIQYCFDELAVGSTPVGGKCVAIPCDQRTDQFVELGEGGKWFLCPEHQDPETLIKLGLLV